MSKVEMYMASDVDVH